MTDINIEQTHTFSNKFQLITKPTQSGKTFVVLSEIEKIFKENIDSNKIINVLFCDNSLLQTDQLKTRLDSTITPIFTDNDGKTSVILSSKSDISKYEDLYTVIFDDECNNVITCANTSRINQIDKLMFKQLKKRDIIKFYIWIDESDKTFTSKFDILEKWNDYSNVEKITFITATPEEHFKNNFNEVNIYQLESAYDEQLFHLFCNSNFIYLDDTINDCITYVFTNYSLIITIGTVWFLPGNIKTNSHNDIKDMCINKGFYVFLINGNEKVLYDNNNNIVCNLDNKKLTENEDLSTTLGNIYIEYNLKNQKVAITGNLCVSRGITISSNKMIISHCIFPNSFRNLNDNYQLAGRLCGNYKNMSNFVIPTIFISKNMKEKIENLENVAINISKHDSMTIDNFYKLKNIDEPVSTKNTFNVEYKEFKTFDELINFFKISSKNDEYLKHIFTGRGPSRTKISENNKVNGFIKNTIIGKTHVYSKQEVLNKIHYGLGNKNYWRHHVCYEDLNDINSTVFILAYISNLHFNSSPSIPIDNVQEIINSTPIINNLPEKVTSTKITKKVKSNITNTESNNKITETKPSIKSNKSIINNITSKIMNTFTSNNKIVEPTTNNIIVESNEKTNNIVQQSTESKKRPPNIQIFGSNTMLLHEHKNFKEYAIYIKKDGVIYDCDINGNYDLINSQSFTSFNLFLKNNIKKHLKDRKTDSVNVYTTLKYYDKKDKLYKKMTDVYEGTILN